MEFKEGVVCFADDVEWFYYNDKNLITKSNTFIRYKNIVELDNFQLNTIKQGDYIPKSELYTEDRFNQAVEVFELFGFYLLKNLSWLVFDMVSCWKGVVIYEDEVVNTTALEGREITFKQLMAIGELKRLMDNRETICGKTKSDFVEDTKRGYELESSNASKSQQAYELLKSLDYEFDSEKERWYRKEWVLTKVDKECYN